MPSGYLTGWQLIGLDCLRGFNAELVSIAVVLVLLNTCSCCQPWIYIVYHLSQIPAAILIIAIERVAVAHGTAPSGCLTGYCWLDLGCLQVFADGLAPLATWCHPWACSLC